MGTLPNDNLIIIDCQMMFDTFENYNIYFFSKYYFIIKFSFDLKTSNII